MSECVFVSEEADCTWFDANDMGSETLGFQSNSFVLEGFDDRPELYPFFMTVEKKLIQSRGIVLDRAAL